MRKIYPALAPVHEDEVYFPCASGEASRVIMNVVATLDGRTRLRGRSQGIGSATDQRLLRQLRAAADAVVHGSGTLRAERVDPGVPLALAARRAAQGRASHPLTVLLAGESPLQLEGAIRTIGPERLIIFCPQTHDVAALREIATVYPVAGARPDPAYVVDVLRGHHGVRVLLVEGGPHVYASFLAANLLDEVFCTIAPVIAGGQPFTMLEGSPELAGPLRLELVSVYEDQGELYLRYRVKRPQGGPGD